MWTQPGHRHGPPPYYDPNPNPAAYGSLYPNPNVGTPTYPTAPVVDMGIPTLSHRGVPSPLATNSAVPSAPVPPPTYGFQAQPPAGAVYNYPSNANPYQLPGSGEDAWVPVSRGSPLPHGAVQAMDRPLENNDKTAKNCYVALWNHNGEPVFGRAWNNNGRTEAWFPHGGNEHSPSSYHILTYQGGHNYRYAWVPVNQLNTMCQPVRQGEYSPVVISDVHAGSFRGELLGKANLTRRMAWISHAGKEHHFNDSRYDKSYVLCRVPL